MPQGKGTQQGQVGQRVQTRPQGGSMAPCVSAGTALPPQLCPSRILDLTTSPKTSSPWPLPKCGPFLPEGRGLSP